MSDDFDTEKGPWKMGLQRSNIPPIFSEGFKTGSIMATEDGPPVLALMTIVVEGRELPFALEPDDARDLARALIEVADFVDAGKKGLN